MESTKFDVFTKALATPTSRRQALRRIGGILGGTALAGLFPGLALAGGGNSAAAHFCASVFGANTPAAGQCTSDAAHGTGLFYNSSCGGNAQSVCCPQNPDGTCTSYSSTTCCGSGQTCASGTCVAACSGVVLSNGTCAQPCAFNVACCGGGFCQLDADIPHFYCTDRQQIANNCVSDSGCPAGYFCDENGFCDHAVTC